LYSVSCPEKLGNKLNFTNTTERVRDVWHTLRPLREVWMKVGLEKLKSHKGVAVKALLDSGATGLFMDMTFARKKRFKMEKSKNPLLVKNVDGMVNTGGAIIHQVECNMFFKGHVERARMDVCNLGKTEVILEMLWLAAHNPEIDWGKGEVEMTHCSPICGKRKQEGKEKRVKKVEKNKDKETLKKLVPKRFWKWEKVFGKKEAERMPVQKTWDHAIELKEGFLPKKGKVYSLLREEREEVQAFVGDQLRKGYIQPFKSPQTSPVHFVAKKDGTWRMVQDYRYINQWTIKNGYLLSLITDILDGVGERKVFTKLDLRWGYNNVRIKEGDKWKTAFTMCIGAYEPAVMYFGLTNSPATFQTMINNLFRDLINQGDMAIFINDILVATETEERHDELVEEVLKRLDENDLFIKPEKCKWKVREVEFLGVVIGPKRVEMQKEKVEEVLNWLVSRNVKEVQKFLGLANYYRRFIKDFARIAALLYVLVRKKQKWKWKKEQEEAFKRLKAVFTTEPVLAIPDIDREMKVEADASDYAIGRVLSTKCEDGK